jgi:hypothetical protein
MRKGREGFPEDPLNQGWLQCPESEDRCISADLYGRAARRLSEGRAGPFERKQRGRAPVQVRPKEAPHKTQCGVAVLAKG